MSSRRRLVAVCGESDPQTSLADLAFELGRGIAQRQAVLICGGLTGVRKIATLAALYRIPVATHNVGGILLTMASVHFAASIHDFLITEVRLGGQQNILSMAANPPVVEHSAIQLTHTPGLGVVLNDEGVKACQMPEDSGWVALP